MVNLKELPASPSRDYMLSNIGKPGMYALEPLDHIAFALILDAGESVEDAIAAIGKIRQAYVDWNEVRVSRVQELARAIDSLDSCQECAERIIEEYNTFFEKRGSLTFDFLEACKVAEGRKLLQQYLPRVKKGAISLLLFEFCPGASLPLSDEGLKQARKLNLVSKTGDRNHLAKAASDALPLSEVAKLVQLIELEAMGHPYGEQPKAPAEKNGKNGARKNGKK